MTLNLIGQIMGSSGYESHCRNLLNSLMKVTDVKLTTMLNPGEELNLTDKELYAYKNKSKSDVNLIITHPLFWRMHSTAKKNIAYLVWEGDKIPKYIVEEILNPEIDKVIVPSFHTAEAALNSTDTEKEKIMSKLVQIPHGVNLDLFYPTTKPEKFTFIANKGWRNLEDRGGIQYLVQAFAEEFKKDEEVELLIKVNPAYGVENIQKMMSELIGKNEDHATIKIMPETIKYTDMVKLYNKGHVFVSPTRAEGFNLPCLEACACGLPVITTNFGGQVDYVSQLNGWLVGGALSPVEHELAYEGIRWLTPSICELRMAMREAFTLGPESLIFKEKQLNALNVAQMLTWDYTAKKIIELI